MTFPTSRQQDSVENVAGEVDSMVSAMLDQMQAWRGRINTNNASSGLEAMANYQRITAVRAYVAAKVAANPAGIAAAYQRRFPSLVNFDPAAEWVVSKAAIDAFVTWFQGAWPKDATGRPVFHAYGPDGQLIDLSVALTGAPKTTALARLDAVLATFA
jgi:hypothetical protein